MSEQKELSYIAKDTRTFYEKWQEAEGLDVIKGMFVEDLRKIPLKPWKRKGGLGVFVHMDGAGEENTAYVCEISPGGSLLAVGDTDGTSIVFCELATGHIQRRVECGYSQGWQRLAFSPDGSVLASGNQGNTVQLWDPATGELRKTLSGHNEAVDSVAFSPDGSILVSTCRDGAVALWDPATGVLRRTLSPKAGRVLRAAFRPDGSMLALGCGDDTAQLWDVATEELRLTLKGHTNDVYAVAFSPDGSMLASGSGDKTIRIWDVATGQPRRRTLVGRVPGGPALSRRGRERADRSRTARGLHASEVDAGRCPTPGRCARSVVQGPGPLTWLSPVWVFFHLRRADRQKQRGNSQ